MILSKCLRQTATHPCGRAHRLISKILEKVSPRGLKSTKLGPKIHQVGLQNPPSWAPKSRKISLGRTLEGSWGHPGPSWPPRPAQDQNIPPKPISGAPLGHPFWRPKISQNQFFKVPRGVHFLIKMKGLGCQEGAQKFVLEVFFGLGRVLGLRWPQDPSRPLPRRIFLDFGAQLGGFWSPT